MYVVAINEKNEYYKSLHQEKYINFQVVMEFYDVTHFILEESDAEKSQWQRHFGAEMMTINAT